MFAYFSVKITVLNLEFDTPSKGSHTSIHISCIFWARGTVLGQSRDIKVKSLPSKGCLEGKPGMETGNWNDSSYMTKCHMAN